MTRLPLQYLISENDVANTGDDAIANGTHAWIRSKYFEDSSHASAARSPTEQCDPSLEQKEHPVPPRLTHGWTNRHQTHHNSSNQHGTVTTPNHNRAWQLISPSNSSHTENIRRQAVKAALDVRVHSDSRLWCTTQIVAANPALWICETTQPHHNSRW